MGPRIRVNVVGGNRGYRSVIVKYACSEENNFSNRGYGSEQMRAHHAAPRLGWVRSMASSCKACRGCSHRAAVERIPVGPGLPG
jgi:hypothetical protein